MAVGGMAVGASVGTNVLEGATVGVDVVVGKASTSAFMGTVTAIVWPSVSKARRPIAYCVGSSRGVINDHTPAASTVVVLTTV